VFFSYESLVVLSALPPIYFVALTLKLGAIAYSAGPAKGSPLHKT